MPVWIVDETGGERAASLEAVAEKASVLLLSALGHEGSLLSVAFVDDEQMQDLNRDWRGKDRPTDVLSFSQIEGEELVEQEDGSLLLGDVIVSIDTMERQAREGGWTDEEELVRLLLHGVLHLLGHDHEKEDEAREMRAEEGRLVAVLAAAGIACAWDASETAADAVNEVEKPS